MAKAKILLVDDQRRSIVSLEKIARNQGYEVYTAEDGADAVGLAEKVRPDLIVLDIQLPSLTRLSDFYRSR